MTITVCVCCLQLSGISQGFLSVDALESGYQEDTASNLVVLLLRLIVSGEVRRWVEGEERATAAYRCV
jgi:hypothetical protein